MPSDPTGDANRLGRLIGVTARQWRRVIDLRLQPFELTEATWAPLVRLARAPAPMRQKDIAAALQLDNSSVVRILRNLEAAGLVERGEDEQDGRAKAIFLTARGEALVRQVARVSEDLERELLTGMDDGEIAAARRLLARISGRLVELGGRRENP